MSQLFRPYDPRTSARRLVSALRTVTPRPPTYIQPSYMGGRGRLTFQQGRMDAQTLGKSFVPGRLGASHGPLAPEGDIYGSLLFTDTGQGDTGNPEESYPERTYAGSAPYMAPGAGGYNPATPVGNPYDDSYRAGLGQDASFIGIQAQVTVPSGSKSPPPAGGNPGQGSNNPGVTTGVSMSNAMGTPMVGSGVAVQNRLSLSGVFVGKRILTGSPLTSPLGLELQLQIANATWYPSDFEAAYYALAALDPISVRNNQEAYAFIIHNPATNKSTVVGLTWSPVENESQGFPAAILALMQQLEQNPDLKLSGWIHTHGRSEGFSNPNENHFSDADKRTTNFYGITGYLGTPSGRMLTIEPYSPEVDQGPLPPDSGYQ